jgi:hypothetical protein
MKSLMKLDNVVAPIYNKPIIKFGDHIYVDIEFGTQWQGICFYWRMIDPEFSLLEIGVDSITGQLRSLTVPLYNGKLATIENVLTESMPEILSGTPIFNKVHWDADLGEVRNRVSDVPGKIRLDLSNEELRIVIEDEAIKRAVLVNNRIICDFNESAELVRLRIINLNQTEHYRLVNESRNVRSSLGRTLSK